MERGAHWTCGSLLAFDLETTGVDRYSDAPVSFALLEVRGEALLAARSSLVDPGRAIPPDATAVHGISTERAQAEGIALQSAIVLVAETLLEASRRAVPVVGMNVGYDLTMVDVQYRRFTGCGLEDQGFVGPVLDALVLDRHVDRYRKGKRTLVDLCRQYDVMMDRAHDAASDARAALDVVMALCRRHPAIGRRDLADLHRAQMLWHSEWARSYGEWRRRKGLQPLDDLEGEWPIAAPAMPTPIVAAVV